ncbi:MAG: non-canonical purine NTP diphosphatase [Bacteroidaceae bacterium]|nr:non-canonical purine NTP diphosphatase [Bacteroidaceae bacterium]
MKRKLVFATNNIHKLREIKEIMPEDIEVLSLADIDCHADIAETAETLEGNALIKARYVYDHYGLDCFADDTGLEVDALDGAPGVHTARYAGEEQNTEANTDKLLAKMKKKSDRSARFRTVIALIEKGVTHLFSGTVEGYITTERRGTQGFGYDPVFSPEDTGLTFAEMGEEKKNQISHRARAVKKLIDYLKNQQQ